MAKENYYFGKPGPLVDYSLAFAACINYCKKHGHKSAWLHLPTLTQATIPEITEVIGEPVSKRLKRGELVDILGVQFILKTDKTLGFSGDGRPILSFWPAEKSITTLDGLKNVPALIVMPWILETLKDWILARNPVDLLEAGASKESSTEARSVVSNPVVEEALKTIRGSINMATGVINQDDKKTVIDTFKILKKAGENYTPSEVQAWLTQNGMPAKYAAEAAAIAAEPGKFRANRAGQFSYLPPNVLERWREKAGAKS